MLLKETCYKNYYLIYYPINNKKLNKKLYIFKEYLTATGNRKTNISAGIYSVAILLKVKIT